MASTKTALVFLLYLIFASPLAASVIAASTSASATALVSASPRTTPTHSITGHIIFQSIASTSMVSEQTPSEPTTLLPESESSSKISDSLESIPDRTGNMLVDAQAKSEKDTLKIECSAAGVEDWDRTLQIAGVFIILAVGGLGAILPIACKNMPLINVSPRIIATGKFFGAGVILATAFVHMLGGATETLKDECLEGKMGDFDAWPGFLAMVSILAMHLMEHLLTMRFVRGSSHSNDAQTANNDTGNGSSIGQSTPRFGATEELLSEKPATGHVHALVLLDMDQRRKQLSTYILELGIALHSVIVGMTLAVTGGSEFKTLLAAISFHQFFEGMALGTRISALSFSRRPLLTALLNALVFALTTPLGQLIGIGIRQSFAPRSPATLVTMGVLDGLSAGILMYSAIVNLLVEEFSAAEFRKCRGVEKTLYFLAMYAGCAAMSVIGKWA
ncbi:hypothetical protein J3B02_001016 [Coemansia erecta]|uniref:Zinc/iron permease n=1 Tax=Coemansia asiatica TaxID=1052880 RepID=A0A9W7XKZ1_9FUNG|nr:hypothetical protein LPJ64_003514 [Coemansia asiatica]KAJ2857420.1 hypothetical protein J3B02_001016 [Coemansia erecta]KAJ2888080.1 hypothetical protein FB639_000886 [Coemansia asiatica]